MARSSALSTSPPVMDADKTGLDDFFAVGGTVEELQALASEHLRPIADDPGEGCPYERNVRGIVWLKPLKDGPVPVWLTNFGAEIVADVFEDDGAETRRRFELEAELSRQNASLYRSRLGLREHELGGRAPRGERDRLSGHWTEGSRPGSDPAPIDRDRGAPRVRPHRVAADRRRLGVPARRRRDRGAGGDPRHRCPPCRRRWSSDAPADPPVDGEQLRPERSGQASSLLEVAPDPIAVPLLGATYRACSRPESDFSLDLVGPTGRGKSELAAIAEQHYGAGFDSRHLPASWSSTENALEALRVHGVSDALLVIDDFAPTGTANRRPPSCTARPTVCCVREGNRSARQRLRPDASSMCLAPWLPRGLIVSTGEDNATRPVAPRSRSLRARGRSRGRRLGVVFPRCRSTRGRDCSRSALAGFLRWLAPHTRIRSGCSSPSRRPSCARTATWLPSIGARRRSSRTCSSATSWRSSMR